jgi:hypothetical protein
LAAGAAHDDRIKPYADRVFYLEDGRLRQLEGMGVDADYAGASSRLPCVLSGAARSG